MPLAWYFSTKMLLWTQGSPIASVLKPSLKLAANHPEHRPKGQKEIYIYISPNHRFFRGELRALSFREGKLIRNTTKSCTVVNEVMHSLSQYMCVFVVLALCTLTRGKIDHTN